MKSGQPVKKKQNQPKTQAAKGKKVVEARRKKILKALAEGKTQKQAGIEAGLSPKTAESQVSKTLKDPKVKQCFAALLDKVVSDERLANKYSDLLDATKVISCNIIAKDGEGMADANSMTRDFVDVPDCATQLRTADSIAKLKGHMVDKVKVEGFEEVLRKIHEKRSGK
jgi:hypothetical protein